MIYNHLLTLQVSYQNFRHHATRATVATMAAVLCVVLPLLAMITSLPTLRLGVKLHQLRIVLIPSACLLLLSPPIIYVAIRTNRARNRALQPYLDELARTVDAHNIPDNPTKAEQKTFRDLLLKELIKPYEATDFRYFLLTQLGKRYPKDSCKFKEIESAKARTLQS